MTVMNTRMSSGTESTPPLSKTFIVWGVLACTATDTSTPGQGDRHRIPGENNSWEKRQKENIQGQAWKTSGEDTAWSVGEHVTQRRGEKLEEDEGTNERSRCVGPLEDRLGLTPTHPQLPGPQGPPGKRQKLHPTAASLAGEVSPCRIGEYSTIRKVKEVSPCRRDGGYPTQEGRS